MSALFQFENYLEQQPMAPTRLWPDEWQGNSQEQPTTSKKPPRAAGHAREFAQMMPPAAGAQALDEIYVWDDRLTVLRFIEENHVRTLLLEARCPLDNAFGHDAIKSLSLVRDDEGFETLLCLVRTRSELEIASRALQSFDERWWLARSQEADGKVNFDFDLV